MFSLTGLCIYNAYFGGFFLTSLSHLYLKFHLPLYSLSAPLWFVFRVLVQMVLPLDVLFQIPHIQINHPEYSHRCNFYDIEKIFICI